MSALTKPKSNSIRVIGSRDKRPLAANVKAFQGGLAVCIVSGTSRGFYAPASDDLIAVPVGRFYETIDNIGGADGAKNVEIQFFKERKVLLMANDTDTPVVAADRESTCYALDDQTATGAVTTTPAGPVYDVTSEGVWVEIGAATMSTAEPPGLSNVAPVDPSSTAASAGSADEAARQDHKHHIALATPAAEGLMSAAYASAVHAPVADRTALKAIAAADRATGMLCLVLSDMSLWRFHASSTAADTTENLIATPAAGSGRWLRADPVVALSLPVTSATTDGATIFTVPVGARLHPREAWWEVSTNWTGGSSSAIGVSSSVTGWDTEGDILGGASGDVQATLVTTNTRMTGTIGATLDTRSDGRLIMVAADTLVFNRITSAFTAGAANVRVLCDVLANLGA
ncbi:hypothetical protein WMF30_40190 [Sorangium sp. So ce134]